MIARLFVVGWIAVAQAAVAGDRTTDLQLTGPFGKDHRVFTIHAANHKRVVIFLKEGTVSTLDVAADFPYSVMFTDSPTTRYKAVVVFEDRQKDIVVDSFGVTAANSIERTDAETHSALAESAAQGRAYGKQLAKEIWGADK